MTQPPDVTGLLVAWANGDAEAKDRLIDAVYGELRALRGAFSGASVPTIPCRRRCSCTRHTYGSSINAGCSGTIARTSLPSPHT